ncbi:MAG: hypothetical protein HZB81_00885 [Deltaproteobacteria bacterium]|nr:hypothetical protein [Deltaproteobacteria bacterium]
MKTVHKKIVLDENNRPSEVIINYNEWQEIERMLESRQKIMSRERLKNYAGIVHLEDDPLEFQRRIRSEWR